MCHKEVAEGGQKKKSNRVKEQAYVQQARSLTARPLSRTDSRISRRVLIRRRSAKNQLVKVKEGFPTVLDDWHTLVFNRAVCIQVTGSA